MENTLEWIKSRRSTRRFQDRAVEREKIEQVLEAGRYAPSGGNSQSTHFLVISNPEVLNRLTVMVRSAFAAMEETPGMYRSIVSSIRASKAGNYVFHYNPPVLILTANQKAYGNNIADCACALENMMLQANALDLGSVWINQLKWLNEDPAILACLQSLGLEPEERVYGALALGYAAEGLPNRTPAARHGNPVTWID